MTIATIKAIRERAAEPIRRDHDRLRLARDLADARADVRALADEIEAYRAAREREFLPSAREAK